MLKTFHPIDKNLLILLLSTKLKEPVDKRRKHLVGLSVTFLLPFNKPPPPQADGLSRGGRYVSCLAQQAAGNITH